jgi:hypothetical protein
MGEALRTRRTHEPTSRSVVTIGRTVRSRSARPTAARTWRAAALMVATSDGRSDWLVARLCRPHGRLARVAVIAARPTRPGSGPGAGCAERSMAAITARNARAAMAKVTCRFHALYSLTWVWSSETVGFRVLEVVLGLPSRSGDLDKVGQGALMAMGRAGAEVRRGR